MSKDQMFKDWTDMQLISLYYVFYKTDINLVLENMIDVVAYGMGEIYGAMHKEMQERNLMDYVARGDHK